MRTFTEGLPSSIRHEVKTYKLEQWQPLYLLLECLKKNQWGDFLFVGCYWQDLRQRTEIITHNNQKRLLEKRLKERIATRLCWCCDAKWQKGHHYKKKWLLMMEIVGDFDGINYSNAQDGGWWNHNVIWLIDLGCSRAGITYIRESIVPFLLTL